MSGEYNYDIFVDAAELIDDVTAISDMFERATDRLRDRLEQRLDITPTVRWEVMSADFMRVGDRLVGLFLVRHPR